jgi:hypothetical protein
LDISAIFLPVKQLKILLSLCSVLATQNLGFIPDLNTAYCNMNEALNKQIFILFSNQAWKTEDPYGAYIHCHYLDSPLSFTSILLEFLILVSSTDLNRNAKRPGMWST